MEETDTFIIVWAFATVIEARWSSGENSKSNVQKKIEHVMAAGA